MPASKLIHNGRVYEPADVRAEAIHRARTVAVLARYIEPLPVGKDLSSPERLSLAIEVASFSTPSHLIPFS